MEMTYTSTAALRDHALRVRAAAPLALCAGRGLDFGTGRIVSASVRMPHAVNVAFTSVDPKQDRPPRGVPR